MSLDLSPTLYPRHLDSLLRESLQDTPAVLVNGPRQCGKTTLVRQYEDEMAYFSLDDPALLAAVRADPLGFVKRLDRAIIDGCSARRTCCWPSLVIDQDRRPGRFLLTAQPNLMALPQIADAGRVEILTLSPCPFWSWPDARMTFFEPAGAKLALDLPVIRSADRYDPAGARGRLSRDAAARHPGPTPGVGARLHEHSH
jgi:hypothetical protein